MNPNDKAMLETCDRGWWCFDGDTWFLILEYFEAEWMCVHGPDPDDRFKNIVQDIDTESIIAIHVPTTKSPQMATAYKIGEPEYVTREEAKEMVKPNWHWLLPDEQQIRHAIDVLPLEIIIGMVEAAYAIESPGGNIYKIKEGGE